MNNFIPLHPETAETLQNQEEAIRGLLSVLQNIMDITWYKTPEMLDQTTHVPFFEKAEQTLIKYKTILEIADKEGKG